MPFGKYQTWELSEIPVPYLQWLRSQPWIGEWLRQAVNRLLADAVDEEQDVQAFSLVPSGNVGQVIYNQDGEAVAWTTDAWVGQVICRLLNENVNLVYKTEEKRHEKREIETAVE